MTRIAARLLILAALICVGGAVGIFVYKNMTGQPKAEHLLTVEKIEQIGRLELLRITVRDVLTQTKDRPFYLPDATALIIVAGEVYAGLDLTKVKEEDFVESDAQVTIRLPRPEILMSKVDHQRSQIYDVKWGGFSTVQLADEGYRAAESKLIFAANTIGYVIACKKSAIALLTPLFSELAKKKVVIEFKN